MKDYSQSISYMRGEMAKQSKTHQRRYLDVIEAMERLNPTEPRRDNTSPNMFCSHCGKEFWFRNEGDRKHGERVCNNCGQHMAWDWR